MPAIPDRWIPYKACGNVIEGTRFICFKVPLKKSVQTGLKDIKEIWDIPALLNKIPNLGAVIDLTNTARYYNPAEFQAAGVLHRKILMPGRIIPPENKVTEFMEAMDELLGKDSESLVGIHCTHGLNRTGYMVCRYMRDRLGVPAKDAIKRFEKARGYQIERENYLADLLGTTPPAPDIGRETSIKPVSNKYLPDSRSPLNNEDEAVEQQARDRYNRYQRCRCNKRCNNYSSSKCNSRYCNSEKSNNDGNSRSNSGRERESHQSNWRDKGSNQPNWRDRGSNQLNWRDKGSNQSNSRSKENYKRNKTNSESSGSSYDFRYDY